MATANSLGVASFDLFIIYQTDNTWLMPDEIGHVALVAITGLNILVPYHYIPVTTIRLKIRGPFY